MSDVFVQPGGPTSCPFCESESTSVRIVRYQQGRKIETRQCGSCSYRWDSDADYTLREAEARGLTGERTGG